MHLTVVILTKDEELHIERSIASVAEIADRVVVVDSGSLDRTQELAATMGAEVLVHPFVTQAHQFNWAINQLEPDTDWILRLDADEILQPDLIEEIRRVLPYADAAVAGAVVSRQIAFLRRPIRWGGVFPVRVLRLFRYGRGCSEQRWMDEHIIVDGPIIELSGKILDDNLKPLSWWIDKHNGYASREVVDIMNSKYNLFSSAPQFRGHLGRASLSKRMAKEYLYGALPIFFRSSIYFLYRFVFRLGILDGKEGIAFHILQGFWYRFLVDMKLFEIESRIHHDKLDPVDAVRQVLGIDLGAKDAR